MASLSTRPNGRFEIQFTDHAKRRRVIRLGTTDRAFAEDFKRGLEMLIEEKTFGYRPGRRTIAWIETLSPKLLDRLHRAGLIERRQTDVTLGELISSHSESLAVEKSTERNVKNATDNLMSYFSSDHLISRTTEAVALKFRAWLTQKGSSHHGPLALATVSRRVRRAREVYEYAVKANWIDSNPFANIRRGNEANRERDFFVTREIADRVCDEIRDPEFRTIFILVRFAGLRVPSEIHPLQWSDINWDTNVLRVVSPKTRRYADGGIRFVPLFDEAREALDILWDTVPVGATLIFPRHQVSGGYLRSKLLKACEAAGIALWPRAWKNPRSSFETELFRSGCHDLKDVARWLGHSVTTATKHYLQMNDDYRAVDASRLMRQTKNTDCSTV